MASSVAQNQRCSQEMSTGKWSRTKAAKGEMFSCYSNIFSFRGPRRHRNVHFFQGFEGPEGVQLCQCFRAVDSGVLKVCLRGVGPRNEWFVDSGSRV